MSALLVQLYVLQNDEQLFKYVPVKFSDWKEFYANIANDCSQNLVIPTR